MGPQRVFPRAMIVPGILHVAHNMALRMDRHLSYWSDWLAGLQSIVTLLHYKDNREAYINRCVKGTMFDNCRSGLHSGLPTTTEWRWNSVDGIVKKLLPLQATLRSTFSAAKMNMATAIAEVAAAQEDGLREKVGKLNPKKIQTTVRNSAWWAFTYMIHTLHGVVTEFQNWAESCVCHWHPRMEKEELAEWTRRCRFWGVMDHEGPFVQCPLSGMRAAELAAGSWRSVFGDLANSSLEDLLSEVDAIDMEDVVWVTRDWEEGKKHIYAQLTLKLQPWTCLPWKAAGLAHYDMELARQVGREIQGMWERPATQIKRLRSSTRLPCSS